jgi:hypothetical protein
MKKAMSEKFTPEAIVEWNKLSEDDQKNWSDPLCQMCKAEFKRDEFTGSIYEGKLALFHQCEECGEKEVRLIETNAERQQAIDDDFERWKAAKHKAHPEIFNQK